MCVRGRGTPNNLEGFRSANTIAHTVSPCAWLESNTLTTVTPTLNRVGSSYPWRYVPGRRASVSHALTSVTAPVSMCGVWVWHWSAWLGTGSQDEYDRVEGLPRCKRCLALIRHNRQGIKVS